METRTEDETVESIRNSVENEYNSYRERRHAHEKEKSHRTSNIDNVYLIIITSSGKLKPFKFPT